MENINQFQQPVYYYPPVAPAPKKEPHKPLNKKDFVFMALIFVSAFLLISLGLWGGFALGFTISYIVFFVVSSVYLFKKFNLFSFICGLMSVAGSITFALYDDEFVGFFMFLLIVGLYVIYAIGISDNFNHKKGSFKMIFDSVLACFRNPFMSFGAIVGGTVQAAKQSKKNFGVLIGIIVAIPFIVVIVPLLSSSDAAFEGLLSNIGENLFIFVVQLILTVIIAPYLFAFVFEKNKSLYKKNGVNKSKSHKLPASACVSFLSVISLIYVVYLFSQLAYFFSAFEGILPKDYHYTASEFARRGFYEMFVICVINVVIISLSMMFAKKKNIAIKLLSCFISLFSILLIVISMQKMKLNISIYGLSKNRIMVSVFMLMLMIVIAFFILHIFAPKISYMQPIIIICSLIFLVLGFCNIDARICEYNIKAYESGEIDDLDINSMYYDLSDSATPYIVDLMHSDNPKVAKRATQITAEKYYNYFISEYPQDNSFKTFNLSSMDAKLSVDDCKTTPLYDNIIEIMGSSDSYNYNEYEDYYETYFYEDVSEDESYANTDKIYKFDEQKGIYVLSDNYD